MRGINRLLFLLFIVIIVIDVFVGIEVNSFDLRSLEEVDTIGEPILLAVDDTLDTGLDNELGALYTRRCSDVERGAVGVVAAPGEFRYGIGLGMEDIGLGDVILILADILKTARSTIVAVGDNHLVLDDEGTHLPPNAVAVLSPYTGHAQIAVVEEELLVLPVLLLVI